MSMLVSFILPAYKAKFLQQAIDSILLQSYTNFELVIVDDCSPENLEEIVLAYDDPRIAYYRNEHNLGGENLVRQWNHSIGYAKGEYLVLAADDDTYELDFLAVCVGLAKKYPEVNLIRARVNCIDESGDDLSHEGQLEQWTSQQAYIYHWVKATTYVCIGNFMFRTTVLREKGFVDFPSAFCSDIATAIVMGEQGVANSEQLLFNFRISSIHLSSSNNNKQLVDKLVANNRFYKWLFAYQDQRQKITTEVDSCFVKQTAYKYLYEKHVFDAYNQVYRYLPLSKLSFVFKFSELLFFDKLKMVLRYLYQKMWGEI